MKKLLLAMLAVCFVSSVQAEEASDQKLERLQEIYKKRLQLIVKYPLSAHWANLESVTLSYLEKVLCECQEGCVTAEFDERKFNTFVWDVRVILRLSSTTDEDRVALVSDIDAYISEDGRFAKTSERLASCEDLYGRENALAALDHMKLKFQEIKSSAQESMS